MRQINLARIVLPSIQTIERSFNDAIVSTFDLLNMFYNITLQSASQKFFNFYIKDSTLGHVRLPQGWSGSPKISRDAMTATFSTDVLKEFKQVNNISETDFPPVDFNQILVTFVNDLDTYTPGPSLLLTRESSPPQSTI